MLRRPRMWETFQRKVAFLRRHGYLDDDNSLNAPARILRHIKIEEIFVTELLVRGILEDRSGEEVFGIMLGLVQSLPRRAKVYMPGDDKWFGIFDQVEKVHESTVVTEGRELMDAEETFTPELMPLGERWAQGESLDSILNDIRSRTDLSGDLVGGFRRAKDLISQIRQVHHHDEARWQQLTEVMQKVSRDEVRVLD